MCSSYMFSYLIIRNQNHSRPILVDNVRFERLI
nr:MAG TPA: hypothetical protein [Bacteriophage sp.]